MKIYEFMKKYENNLLFHNFLNTYPFLMIFVPFESSQSQLSNGINFIKNGSILRNIWGIEWTAFKRLTKWSKTIYNVYNERIREQSN